MSEYTAGWEYHDVVAHETEVRSGTRRNKTFSVTTVALALQQESHRCWRSSFHLEIITHVVLRRKKTPIDTHQTKHIERSFPNSSCTSQIRQARVGERRPTFSSLQICAPVLFTTTIPQGTTTAEYRGQKGHFRSWNSKNRSELIARLTKNRT